MKHKMQTILKCLPSYLVVLPLIISATLKLSSFPFLVQAFAEMGLGAYLKIFGATEILLAVLFLYPRTMKIGFLLLTAYFGGAIAVEVAHGSFIAPVVILSVIWIAAYLRRPEIFKEKKSAAKQPFLQNKLAA
jgi:hypothetical protein